MIFFCLRAKGKCCPFFRQIIEAKLLKPFDDENALSFGLEQGEMLPIFLQTKTMTVGF